jgi:low temperature requirement protein LtrA
MTVPQPALLRSSHVKDSSKVGWVELFFDLVFVFSVTQLSHLLIADATWNGAAETTFLTLVVWVAWMWTTWAMNWLDARHPAVRVLLFVMMAAGLVLSAAIPEAFGERALAFAGAYVFIQNVRTLFTVFALRGGQHNEYVNFIRIEIWLAFASIFWIAGALFEGEARWALWITGLAIDVFAPWVRFWCPGLGSSTVADWSVDPAHIAERCGLFVIIALGESVIMTGATFAELQWDTYNAPAFAAAFIGTVAMWWVYFATTAEEATELFERRADPGAVARAAYTYAHIPIIAGIILTAVGDELVPPIPSGLWR